MDLDLVAFVQAERSIALVVLRTIAQLRSGQAIHIHGARGIRQVEVAVGRIDGATDRTHKFVHLGVGLGSRIELSDGHRLHVTRIRARRRAAVVQGIQIGLSGHRLGRIAAIVHQLTADDDFVTHLDVRAGSVLHIAEIQDAVAVELVGLGTVVGNPERGVSEGTALTEGAFVRDAGDLALHIHFTRGVILRIGRPGKVLDGIGSTEGVVRIADGTGSLGFAGRTRRRDTAARITVQGVHISLAGHRLGRVAAIVHELAADDDFVAHLDVGLAALELLVAQIQDPEAVELTGRSAVLGNVERGIAEGAALGEGAVVRDAGNLALHIHFTRGVVGIIVRPSKGRDSRHGTCRVVRIVEGTGTLRLSGRRGSATVTDTVQFIQEGTALHGLRGVALVIDDLAAYDDLVAHLDVGLAGLEFLVSEVQDAVAVELVVRGTVIGDVERGVAEGAALGEGTGIGDLGDDTLHEHRVGTLYIGAEGFDILVDPGHGERVLQGSYDLLALLTRLGDIEGLVIVVDVELDLLGAVVTGIFQDGDLGALRRARPFTGIRRDGNPGNLIGIPLDLRRPVPGGGHAEVEDREFLVGREGCLLGLVVDRESRPVDLDGREVVVGFFLPAAGKERGCSGKQGKEACTEFHMMDHWLFGFTVEGIQVGLAGYGFRGIALVVHQFAVDDHVISYLDVGLAFRELHVPEVQGTEHIELAIAGAVR